MELANEMLITRQTAMLYRDVVGFDLDVYASWKSWSFRNHHSKGKGGRLPATGACLLSTEGPGVNIRNLCLWLLTDLVPQSHPDKVGNCPI